MTHLPARRIGTRQLIVTSIVAVTLFAAAACTSSSKKSTATQSTATQSTATQSTATQSTATQSTATQNNGLIVEVSAPTSVVGFGSIEMGSVAAAKALGFKFQYAAPADLSNLGPDISNLIKEAIGLHPAAIVVGNFVPSAFDPVIKQATQAHIPVVVLDSGESSYASDGAVAFVGIDQAVNGQSSGQEAVKLGVHDLLCINPVPQNPELTAVCTAAAAVLTKNGGSGEQLTAPAADYSNPAAMTQDIQGFLSSHPSIDGVYTIGANFVPSVLTAIKNINKSGKIKVGTGDVSNLVLNDIKAGTLGWAMDKDPYIEGYDAVQAAAQYVLYGTAPVQPVWTGPQVVDSSNVQVALDVQAKYPGLRGDQ